MNEVISQRRPLLSVPAELLAGVRDTVPLIIGAIPFGIIFGTLATGSGLSFAGAMAMSAFVFAGSSQFIALGLLAAGTGWPLIVLTTFVVNLRHLLYAASLLPYVSHLSQLWRIPLAFWLTDETFAVVINRYQQPGPVTHKHWYYLSSALAMYLNWQFCTWLGLTFGRLVPDIANWGLDFAMPVTFIGMVIPYLKNSPMRVAVAVAGTTAVLAQPLPHKLGLMLATLAGIISGLGVELYQRKEI
jgi:4-azaleucine resistance transporter AzlC